MQSKFNLSRDMYIPGKRRTTSVIDRSPNNLSRYVVENDLGTLVARITNIPKRRL